MPSTVSRRRATARGGVLRGGRAADRAGGGSRWPGMRAGVRCGMRALLLALLAASPAAEAQTPDASAASAAAALSPQERRVLALVAEGKTNKEIAERLNLSDNTVKNYLGSVFEKLQVKRRSQAAAIYVQSTPPPA